MTATQTFAVVGMSCQHCVDAVTAEVGRLPGVEQVTVTVHKPFAPVMEIFEDVTLRITR